MPWTGVIQAGAEWSSCDGRVGKDVTHGRREGSPRVPGFIDTDHKAAKAVTATKETMSSSHLHTSPDSAVMMNVGERGFIAIVSEFSEKNKTISSGHLSIANIHWIIKKSKSSRKISTFALLTMPKPLTVWITTNCGKF